MCGRVESCGTLPRVLTDSSRRTQRRRNETAAAHETQQQQEKRGPSGQERARIVSRSIGIGFGLPREREIFFFQVCMPSGGGVLPNLKSTQNAVAGDVKCELLRATRRLSAIKLSL